jgi:hypothetical protein
MLRRCLIVASIFLVVGCTSPQMVWNKPGMTVEEFRRDTYVCVQQSRTSWAGGGSGALGLGLMLHAQREAQLEANRLYKMCMEAHGYTGHEKQEGETVFPGVSQPKTPQPLAPPRPVASLVPSVPQQGVQPSVTGPAVAPQAMSPQGDRQLVAPLPQPERKATFDVVQLQSRYSASRLFLRPDMSAERLTPVSAVSNLKVIENRGTWLCIETPDERRGWILREWVQQ